MKNILFIILIVVNVGLIITCIHFINNMDKLEARLVEIENEIKSPEVKIVPLR